NAGNYYSTRATPPVHGPSAVGLLAAPHARSLLAPAAAGPAPARELDLGRAEALHRQAVALAQELVRDFPNIPDYRNQLANTHVSLGFVLAGRDQAGAARVWQTAHDLLAELVEDFPKVAEYRGDLGMTQGNLGWLRARQGRWADAADLLQDGIGN